MYMLIRIILMILLFPLIAYLLFKAFDLKYYSKKHNPEMYEKAQNSRKPVGKIIGWFFSMVLVVIIIANTISIPWEGAFVTFDSVETAIRYIGLDPEAVIAYETQSATFIIEDSKVYSVTHTNGRFSVPDYKCTTASYHEPVAINSILSGIPKACYNKETNETLYLVTVYGDNEPKEITLNANDAVLVDSYSKVIEDRTIKYYQYACVMNGSLCEEIELHTFGIRTYSTTLEKN